MSTDSTDFTLLEAALDLTSSLDLKAGLQNFVNQACALTSSPHATLTVLDTWGATTLQLEHHDTLPAPDVPRALITAPSLFSSTRPPTRPTSTFRRPLPRSSASRSWFTSRCTEGSISRGSRGDTRPATRPWSPRWLRLPASPLRTLTSTRTHAVRNAGSAPLSL